MSEGIVRVNVSVNKGEGAIISAQMKAAVYTKDKFGKVLAIKDVEKPVGIPLPDCKAVSICGVGLDFP